MRFQSQPSFLVSLVMMAFLGLYSVSFGIAKEKEIDLRKWWNGPTRYLISKGEVDFFKLLETDQERREFVLKFWKIRDPDPRTPENEFRDLFWKRVESANFLFRDETSKPGWRTDRGKTYIMLGPPDEIQEDHLLPGSRRHILWTYQTTHSVYMKRNANIMFIEDPSGEFRLALNEAPGALIDSNLSRLADLQGLMKSPAPSMTHYEQVQSLSSLNPDLFLVHPDYYLAEDSNTFVALTVGMHGSALPGTGGAADSEPPRVHISGKLVAADGRFYNLSGERGFAASEENRSLTANDFYLYQAGFTVPPGSYNTYFAIQDWTSGNLLTFRETLEVPDFFSNDFFISTITLARKLERVSEGSTPERKIPFVLGNLKVVPRADALFRNGEEFSFYYQIYNASRSGPAGKVDVNVTYRFFHRPTGLESLAFEPLGKPMFLYHMQEEVQGYTFSLEDWPAADYRLRINVVDNRTGQGVEQDALFRIQEPP
ncbi:MAG: GWxTD domain-containing protein [Acidobacteria bacterium]|nr:GWxTD domain-containing protein [Acidobacteriota bacterium]